MKKKIINLLLISIFVGALTSCQLTKEGSAIVNRSEVQNDPISSASDPRWLADLERIGVSRNCQEIWDILWSWSKKGNLHARQTILFLYMYHGFDRPRDMPLDESAWMHDSLIMSVYSLGYTGASDLDASHRELALNPIRLLARHKLLKNSRFIRCVDKKPSQECVPLAIEEQIVPPFEAYIQEIDRALAKGKKPRCEWLKRLDNF